MSIVARSSQSTRCMRYDRHRSPAARAVGSVPPCRLSRSTPIGSTVRRSRIAVDASSLDPHVGQVARDLGFELLQLGVEVTDGLGVALAELLDPRDESERQRIDLADDAARDGCVPLVVEHERSSRRPR